MTKYDTVIRTANEPVTFEKVLKCEVAFLADRTFATDQIVLWFTFLGSRRTLSV